MRSHVSLFNAVDVWPSSSTLERQVSTVSVAYRLLVNDADGYFALSIVYAKTKAIFGSPSKECGVPVRQASERGLVRLAICIFMWFWKKVDAIQEFGFVLGDRLGEPRGRKNLHFDRFMYLLRATEKRGQFVNVVLAQVRGGILRHLNWQRSVQCGWTQIYTWIMLW